MVEIYNKQQDLQAAIGQIIEKGTWQVLDDYLEQEQTKMNEEVSK